MLDPGPPHYGPFVLLRTLISESAATHDPRDRRIR